MIYLRNLIVEQTAATKFCKQDVLSKPEFSANKWSAIGIWSKRNIAGTNTPSQHSYGNAIDWHGAKGIGDPIMQELADYLVDNASKYHIANVIYNRKIWNQPNGWYHYSGQNPHTNHVHVDFKSSNSKNFVNQKNNDVIQRAVWNVYNITTRFPAKYFKRFKGSPWIYGDDKPKEASKYLLALYKLNWLDTFDEIITTASQEDLKNIELLNEAVKAVAKLIANGDSGKVSFKFKKWDSKQQQYKTIGQSFNWQFM